jgi:hypothetical protein
MTMTFVEGTAGHDLDQIARSFVDNEHMTYPAAFTRACSEHPSLYAQYDQTYREQNATLIEQAQQPRQSTEIPYHPGQAAKQYAYDLASEAAHEIMAKRPGLTFAQAYTEALTNDPSLYETHLQGERIQAYAEQAGIPAQQSRQFGDWTQSNADSWGTGSTASQNLLERHNTLVAQEYRLCPSDTPRSVVEARVFQKHPRHHAKMASYR